SASVPRAEPETSVAAMETSAAATRTGKTRSMTKSPSRRLWQSGRFKPARGYHGVRGSRLVPPAPQHALCHRRHRRAAERRKIDVSERGPLRAAGDRVAAAADH